MENTINPKFALGQISATQAFCSETEQVDQELICNLLRRHAAGDWGDCKSTENNEENLKTMQDYVLSIFNIGSLTIWIITYLESQITTLMLPSDY